MQVVDIMSAPPVTVGPTDRLETAVETMLDAHIGSVVVVEAGPVGILTRSDVLAALLETDGLATDDRVEELMTPDPETVPSSATVEMVLRQMETHEVKRFPVLDGLDLVGVITVTDIARHLPDRVDEVRRAMHQQDRWRD